MTPAQWVLTVIAWFLGIGGVVFVYVVQLANAMKTTGPPLPLRMAAVAMAPALVCSVLLVGQVALARHAGNLRVALLWNSPALLGAGLAFLMVGMGWIGDQPWARRLEARRFLAAQDDQMKVIWERSGRLKGWNLHVERGVQIDLPGVDGSARIGMDWTIGFTADGADRSVAVRSASDSGLPMDIEKHARRVLQELKQRLDSGWRPGAADDGPIEIAVGK